MMDQRLDAMNTIRTQHPRCSRCKTRLTVHGVCLSCEPPRQPRDWTVYFVGVAIIVCAALLAVIHAQTQPPATVETAP